jgi:uncharacterized repeat protein (TIGR02543 family)
MEHGPGRTRCSATRCLAALAVTLVAMVSGGCGGGGGGGGTPSTYTVTYGGNGATGGNVPVDSNVYSEGQTVTVLGNTGSLVRTGYSFGGWNTQAAGSGTTYSTGQTFVMGTANVALYAQWTANGASGFTVTYVGNGTTGGSVPTDSNHYTQGQTVTVLGNPGSLAYTGYSFVGWQTKADGSGTALAQGTTFSMGSANVTLYALWAGGYAYSANHQGGVGGSVSQYTIGPNGALTPMFTPSVTTGGNDPRYLSADPSGKYLYVSNIEGPSSITGCANGCGNVSQFTIGASGALAPMSTLTVATDVYPVGSAVHPSGKWFYVANNQRSNVGQYTIGTDGMLSAMTPSTVAAGTYPDAVAIDPSGKYAYVVNGDANTVSQYTIDQTSGALTPMSPPTVAAGSNAFEIKIASTPSGTYAYVANYSGTVSEYRIDPATGKLSSIGTFTIPGGQLALSIAVHPTGKFAYVPTCCASPSSVIAQFTIDQTSGTLAANGTVSAGGAAAASVAIDSSGKYAYATSGVSGWGSASIAQYTIDPTTGVLTLMSNPTVLARYGPSEIVTVGK